MDTRALSCGWQRIANPFVMRRVLALFLGGLALSQSAFAQTACQVTYAKAWEGGNGFGANITINNTGAAITGGWSLVFTFPGTQRVTNGWPVSFSQPAGSAVVTISSNAAWNENIPAGGS